MIRFSANLGFLWANETLPNAIRAAKTAGFDAVECHWPYEFSAAEVKAALEETGLAMLGLNTRRDVTKSNENGLCALPGREADARALIDEAISYAGAIRAGAVHVMAGFASGRDAHITFVDNLKYAIEAAKTHGTTILIEPLNRHDAPGYFLQTTDQARDLIDEIASPNLKLMFDCYHVGRTEGDLTTRLNDLLPVVGHIQFASVPDRGTPDHGELNYADIFTTIDQLGWNSPLGAEYKPQASTEATLGWLSHDWPTKRM